MGLVPHWSKDINVKFSNINARAETIATSAAYRFAFLKQRCLIPAIGFYEWAKLEDGTKWPYYFRLKSRPVFAFAGIWDRWKDAEDKEFLTCAIITCQTNSVVGNIHPRMPVILSEKDEGAWLDNTQEAPALRALLTPHDERDMVGIRVSRRVNNPRFDDNSLTQPYTPKES